MENPVNASSEQEIPQASTGRLAAGLIGLLAALMSIRTISNSDFWLHLASGRQFATHGISRVDPFSFATESKAAWVQATWLYDWIVQALWRLGDAPLVVVVHALLAAAAFALMTMQSRPRTYAGLLAGALALWMAAPQLVVRPTLAAFLCAAATIWAVRQHASRRQLLCTLLPLQAIWTNCHLTFLLGPALAALSALDLELSARRETTAAAADGARRQVRDLVFTASAMLIATVVNPYGLRLHGQAFRQFIRPADGWLLEWISPYSSLFDQGWLGAIPTVTLACIALGFVLHRQRLPWFASVLGVVSAFVIVWTPQHVEWCALLALPFLTLSTASVCESLERALPPGKIRVAGSALTALGLLTWLGTGWNFASSAYYRDAGSGSRFGWSSQTDLFPFDAVHNILREPGFPKRLYNLPLDGGALLWAQPNEKVLVDARTTVFGNAFLRDLNLALRGDQHRWTEITRRWPADAFVFNCCWNGSGSIIRSLLMSRQWSIAYFDGTSAVLIPALRRNIAWMRRGPIQQAGLDLLERDRKAYSEAVARGERPPNPSRLVGAAAFLQSIGQFREAASLYSLLARGSPDMTGAWLNLGICQVQRGEPLPAIPILEYTRQRVPKHVMVYLWLSRAYRETGRGDDADAAYAKAVALDRPVAEAFAGLANTNQAPATLQDGGRSIR